MFKKIVSNLPFNPSLVGQLSFYLKRLQQEAFIRQMGVFIMSLALVVQVFAVISPPESTMAQSENDLIVGGIRSKQDANQVCQKNIRNYKTILSHYGISCNDLLQTTDVTLKSTDYSRNLYSMGHLRYGKAGETQVNIGGETFWLRYLWSWDSGAYSTYKALKGTTKDGLTFFVLYNCGNLVFIGLPTPPKKCKWNPNLLASDPKCFEPCPVDGKEHLPKNSPKCFEPCKWNTSIPSSHPKCFKPCHVKGKEHIPKNSADCYIPCRYDDSIKSSDPNCKPCEESQTRTNKTACVEHSKSAANITQGFDDANGTTAKPKDIIVYELRATNKGKAVIEKYEIQENISDILDYATITSLNGANKDERGVISWPAIRLEAGETITKKFEVKIKNPLPNTPTSTSDPGHFDMEMVNVYGNTVTIKLPPSIVKRTEIVTKTLPNTGPGTSISIIFGLVAFISYFYARSRQLATEVELVKQDYAEGGI